jgi:hypothetical protein
VSSFFSFSGRNTPLLLPVLLPVLPPMLLALALMLPQAILGRQHREHRALTWAEQYLSQYQIPVRRYRRVGHQAQGQQWMEQMEQDRRWHRQQGRQWDRQVFASEVLFWSF